MLKSFAKPLWWIFSSVILFFSSRFWFIFAIILLLFVFLFYLWLVFSCLCSFCNLPQASLWQWVQTPLPRTHSSPFTVHFWGFTVFHWAVASCSLLALWSFVEILALGEFFEDLQNNPCALAREKVQRWPKGFLVLAPPGAHLGNCTSKEWFLKSWR